NVDNTSDANKPVSTATQSALDAKVDKVDGERLINASEITKLSNQSGTNTGDQDLSSFATTTALDLKANIDSPTFTGTVNGITATMVGLPNVDNTSDANKPVSTATQTALDTKVDKVDGERLINASEITKLSNQSGTNTGDQDISGIAVNTSKIGDLTSLTTTTNSNLVAAVNEIQAEKANLDSPTLTGTPLAPTATEGTNTTQIATTEFVNSAASSSKFVDLTTVQTISGLKTFSSDLIANELTIGRGTGDLIYNTALGYQSLKSNEGESNTAIGYQTLRSNLGGGNNTAIGYNSLGSNISGGGNTASGNNSLGFNTSGGGNTASGNNSLAQNTTGKYNSAFGAQSMENTINGENNTAIGVAAIDANTTGSNNAVLGAFAGRETASSNPNTIINNSVLIGFETKPNDNNEENQIVIGYRAIGNGSNTIQLGNTAITDVKTSGAITAAGYKTPSGTSSQYLMADGSFSSAVSTGNIEDGAVTLAKIADAAVTSDKIAAETIVNANISTTAAIAYSKLNLENSIVSSDLASSSVTSAKIADA
ncbi:hypothetical protein AAGV28_15360, partial [Flavobacterium sp. FZUC8N2.13]